MVSLVSSLSVVRRVHLSIPLPKRVDMMLEVLLTESRRTQEVDAFRDRSKLGPGMGTPPPLVRINEVRCSCFC